MRIFTLRVFNETPLSNTDFVAGLRAAQDYLNRFPFPIDVGVSVDLVPKSGRIPDNLIGMRRKGTKFLCLVEDASRGVALANKFGLRLTDDERRQAFEERVAGMAPFRRPAFFLWDFEINGRKKFPESFATRLRNSGLHEMGHSFGLVHGRDAKQKERDDDLDLMRRQPDVWKPELRYVPVDIQHMVESIIRFVELDPGGFKYGAL